VVGVALLVSLVSCGSKTNPAPPNAAAVAALESATAAAARAFGSYYRAENDGVVDAYIERSQRNGLPVSRVERCLLATGALSRRPSILANPPVSPSAIRQRSAAVAAIGAYLSTLAAVAGGSDEGVIVASLANLRSQATDLRRAANVHDQGDLFLEDTASQIDEDINPLNNDSERAQIARQLRAIEAPIRRLTAILAADVDRQRVDTVDAATLAFDLWQARLQGKPSAAAHTRTGPPFCSEPSIFQRPNSVSGGVMPGKPADPRGARLWSRMEAVRSADPDSLLRAMSALDDSEMQLLGNPQNLEIVARANAARAELQRVANALTRESLAF
jgi:hypothetical protein